MDKTILTFAEACAYTGFSESYMYKLTSGRMIPHSKPHGKKIFFNKGQLDKWLMGNPIKTSDEIDKEVATHVTTGEFKPEVVLPLDRLPELYEKHKPKK